MRSLALAAVVAALGSAPLVAQANANPNIDVELAFLDSFSNRGRVGVFPNGTNGFSMSTTICNRGTEIVEWMAAMNPNHPFISFLVAREWNGRFEQVSDWSYVKHGWFALASSQCSTCTPPPGGAGPYLGLGCSDTYGVGNNSNRYDLGPPDEIDPWLGQWDPMCSHFDLGLTATTCDGNRSLTNAQVSTYNTIENRINIKDADLDVAGAEFFYQGFYAVESEPDSAREDSMSSRAVDFTWGGVSWSASAHGSIQHGTILNRWDGAEIESNTNGNDQGRVYVAARVTGPSISGSYHYRYAFHNRDNKRGIGAITIPFCPSSVASSVSFRDIDSDPSNDWSVSSTAGNVTLSTTTNPLRWNTIYNVSFIAESPPGFYGDIVLEQFDPGAGAPSFSVAHPDLTGSSTLGGTVSQIGGGCGFPVIQPPLIATGTPPRALLGNGSFGFRANAGAGQPAFLFYNVTPGSFSLGPCTVFMGGFPNLYASSIADSAGRAAFSTPIPNDPSIDGVRVNFQAAVVYGGGGPLFGSFSLSSAVQVLIGGGNSGTCP